MAQHRTIRPAANRLVGWTDSDEKEYRETIRRIRRVTKIEDRLERERYRTPMVDYSKYDRYTPIPAYIFKTNRKKKS